MKRLIVVFLTMLLALSAAAQVDDSDIIDEMLVNAAEDDDEQTAEIALMNCEYIEALSESKSNINALNNSELQQIPFVNFVQIGDIMDYRLQNGDILNIGELKGVPSLSANSIRWLSRFFDAGSGTSRRDASLREMLGRGRHTLSSSVKTVLQRQAAYIPDSNGVSKFDGGRAAWWVKYRYKFQDRLAWGLTCEKDAGEPFGFDDYRYGMDFYSMYLRISKLGVFDKIILGDYTAKFGQGLMLGGGFSMGKSMGVVSGGGTQIREYGSLDENRYYRGVASTIKLNCLSLTTFASLNLMDASCEDTVFHSFRTDGYHRTAREQSNKDNLREFVGGMMADVQIKKLQIGLAAQYYDYDKPYVPREQLRYANLRSEQNGVGASVSYRYNGKYACFYGETAFDKRYNVATLNAFDFLPADNFRLRMVYRHYSAKYQSFKAVSFGQSSKANNEDGVYVGVYAEPCKWLSMESWADVFRLPWTGAYNKMPTSGREAMWQGTFHAGKKYDFRLRLKHKYRQLSDEIQDCQKTGYIRAASIYKPTEDWNLTSSVQWSVSKSAEVEHGYLVSQDFKWNPKNLPLSLSMRYALFSAPYAARIYAYESNVGGTFASPGYYYEGQRLYLVAGCNIGSKINLQFKISQWQYFDRQQIGGGDSLIDGSKKTELNVYVRYEL
ncbi:MAG: helix-hairpin-helix domain-containing protein [Bacteroidales bacterium]|nr:helix-hairpin-helix domain-containing protein [Bacteroidales bacterium]